MKRKKKTTPTGETLEALGTDSGCQRSKGDRGLTETERMRKAEGKRKCGLRRGQEACEGDKGV